MGCSSRQGQGVRESWMLAMLSSLSLLLPGSLWKLSSSSYSVEQKRWAECLSFSRTCVRYFPFGVRGSWLCPVGSLGASWSCGELTAFQSPGWTLVRSGISCLVSLLMSLRLNSVQSTAIKISCAYQIRLLQILSELLWVS